MDRTRMVKPLCYYFLFLCNFFLWLHDFLAIVLVKALANKRKINIVTVTLLWDVWFYLTFSCTRHCRTFISLGRPEIFEKVAKIGVGVHIWPLQVSKLTHY